MQQYLLSLDQGTSSSRAILFDCRGRSVAQAQQEIAIQYPKSGWVEQDAEAIYRSQLDVLTQVLNDSAVDPAQIKAIGIANQRETTVVWDKATGQPIYPAIVWQCRRTAEIIAKLDQPEFRRYVRDVTGLIPDAYFSASKISWLLDQVPEARERAERGELLFGTIDTWLIWNLTGGKVHATDCSNASRTMLFDLHQLTWDDYLLETFRIPRAMLPRVLGSDGTFGSFSYKGHEIPIRGVLGDQQAALFGHGCYTAGEAKITYGTGCFMLMQLGREARSSDNGLLTTVAYSHGNSVNYAMEGSVFVGGALIQWLRDELGIISTAGDVGGLAAAVPDNGGVYVVPAFTGLGAPYWDMDARGTIVGLTRGSNRNHLARACEEAIAYQCYDLIRTVEEDTGLDLQQLKVDGGATRDDFLMQFQADILDCELRRPHETETTALGAALMAGLSCGVWQDLSELSEIVTRNDTFRPQMCEQTRQYLIENWHRAVERSRDWALDEE